MSSSCDSHSHFECLDVATPQEYGWVKSAGFWDGVGSGAGVSRGAHRTMRLVAGVCELITFLRTRVESTLGRPAALLLSAEVCYLRGVSNNLNSDVLVGLELQHSHTHYHLLKRPRI